MFCRFSVCFFVFSLFFVSVLCGEVDLKSGTAGIGARDRYFRTNTVPPTVSPRVYKAVEILEQKSRLSNDMLSRSEILAILAGESVLENSVQFGYVAHICRTAQVTRKTTSHFTSALKLLQEEDPDIQCESTVRWVVNNPFPFLPPPGTATSVYSWAYGDQEVIEYLSGENWLGDIVCVHEDRGHSYIVEKPTGAITSVYYQPEIKYDLLFPRWHPLRQMRILPNGACLSGIPSESCGLEKLRKAFVFEKTETIRGVECVVVGDLKWACYIPKDNPARIWGEENGFPEGVKLSDGALSFWGSIRTTRHFDKYVEVAAGFEIPLWSEEKCVSADGDIEYVIETTSALNPKKTSIGDLKKYEPYYLVDAVNGDSRYVGNALEQNAGQHSEGGESRLTWTWIVVANLVVLCIIFAVMKRRRNISSSTVD